MLVILHGSMVFDLEIPEIQKRQTNAVDSIRNVSTGPVHFAYGATGRISKRHLASCKIEMRQGVDFEPRPYNVGMPSA